VKLSSTSTTKECTRQKRKKEKEKDKIFKKKQAEITVLSQPS